MDRATDHRRPSGRHHAAMVVARPRMPSTGTCSAAVSPAWTSRRSSPVHQVLGTSVCRETDRIPASRVSGSRHRPQPSASAAHARSVCFLPCWARSRETEGSAWYSSQGAIKSTSSGKPASMRVPTTMSPEIPEK
jgi:hypothetical protein